MKTDFFLIGDSNSAVIGRAAKAEGYSFSGGSNAPGRLFDTPFFEVRDGNFCWIAEGADRAIEQYKDLLAWDGPILSTVGFNTQFIGQFVGREMRKNGLDATKLSDAVIHALVETWKQPALAFYDLLLEHGKSVWFVPSPQRFPEVYFDTAIKLEAALIAMLTEKGVPSVDVRAEITDANGRLLEHLHSDMPKDNTHAGMEAGKIIFREFTRLAKIER